MADERNHFVGDEGESGKSGTGQGSGPVSEGRDPAAAGQASSDVETGGGTTGAHGSGARDQQQQSEGGS